MKVSTRFRHGVGYWIQHEGAKLPRAVEICGDQTHDIPGTGGGGGVVNETHEVHLVWQGKQVGVGCYLSCLQPNLHLNPT